MQLVDFVDRLDSTLRTDAYADIDASANGLQVGPPDRSIETVAFAVDAATATIEAAIEVDADVLVTHHGISWGGIERVTGREYNLVEQLIRNDIALYVSHLPLDGHQEIGNAAGIADALSLVDREPFGALGPEHIGQKGVFETPQSPDAIATTLDAFERSKPTHVLAFGPDEPTDVAIVTGSGTDWFAEASNTGVDALITGEGKQKVYHEAREAGVSVFLAGHYATETFGVRSVQALASQWGLTTEYISHPTGL